MPSRLMELRTAALVARERAKAFAREGNGPASVLERQESERLDAIANTLDPAAGPAFEELISAQRRAGLEGAAADTAALHRAWLSNHEAAMSGAEPALSKLPAGVDQRLCLGGVGLAERPPASFHAGPGFVEKIAEHTGESLEEVRAALERQGWTEEPTP